MKRLVLCAVVVLAGVGRVDALIIQWETNGHYYDIIEHPDGIDWFTAKAEAESLSYSGMTGHLATITSQAENDFVMDELTPMAPAKFYWLGGYQPADSPEPDGNWKWITGEPWEYSNWFTGEPNGATEDWLELYGPLTGFAEISYWNDLAWRWENDAYIVRAYVVEYGTTVIPEPSSLIVWSLIVLTFGGTGWYRRRKA